MKKIIFVLVFASSSVFACPDLAGTYSCTGSEDPYQMEIVQSIDDDITTYIITAEGEEKAYIADGVGRAETVTEDGYTLSGTLTTTCLEKTAGFQFIADYQGYSIDHNDGFTLLDDGTLLEEIITYVDGNIYAKESYNCTRTN